MSIFSKRFRRRASIRGFARNRQACHHRRREDVRTIKGLEGKRCDCLQQLIPAQHRDQIEDRGERRRDRTAIGARKFRSYGCHAIERRAAITNDSGTAKPSASEIVAACAISHEKSWSAENHKRRLSTFCNR